KHLPDPAHHPATARASQGRGAPDRRPLPRQPRGRQQQLAALSGRDQRRPQAGGRYLFQAREFAGAPDYAGRCKMKTGGRLAPAFAIWVASAVAWAQEYPKTPPPPAPLTAAAFPPFHETVLPNGLRLLVVESHKQPVVSLSLNFGAGSSRDPA